MHRWSTEASTADFAYVPGDTADCQTGEIDVEIGAAETAGGAGVSVPETSPHERHFERIPPHDLAAEQCVLGSMLLSQTAIAEVLELIQTRDFYRPAHQTVYDRVLDLY